MRRRVGSLTLVSGLIAAAAPVAAQTPPPAPSPLAPAATTQTPPQPLPPFADPSLGITVTATRLDEARSSIQPSLGATTYDFSQRTIGNVPQGENAPLNQVLLRAPGVVQDSFGQIHVRGDHGNVQYRLDGVQLPEGLSLFNNILATRYADQMSLLTGALPAQYGLHTAGIVDITVKSGTTNPGAEVSVTGGSRDYSQPAFSYGGRTGAIDYFAAGQYIHNGLGIENPTSSFSPIHDDTDQWYGLAKITGIVDDNTRLAFIAGGASSAFQIPNVAQPDGELRRQRPDRLQQRDSRPAPVGAELLRHRLAAEELPGPELPALGLRPLFQAVLPARSIRRPGVQRHRAVDPANELRHRRAGRRLLEGPRQAHGARRLPGAARARHRQHPGQYPAAGPERSRRPDQRSGSVRPTLRLHRQLRSHRLDLQRLPAGRMAGRAHRHGEFRPAFRRHQRPHARRTSSARASTSCGSPTRCSPSAPATRATSRRRRSSR